jgi:glycosyl transferase family 25
MAALPVFVINLERDRERRRHMTELLGRLGLVAEFITAVDGRALSDTDRAAYDRTRALRVYGVEMMDTEIACFLSHRRLYERMLRDGIETALIMEDDVRVEPTLPTVLDGLLAASQIDWAVVRLDSKRDQVIAPPDAGKFLGTRVAELPGGAALYRLRTHVLGVGAYLIRREGARRMLAYANRIFMPIDQTMDRYWENGVLPFVVRPFQVHQGEDFGSSTGVRPLDRRSTQPLSVRVRRRLQRVTDGVRKRAFNLAH